MESLNKLKVVDLKKLLKQKSLSTDGNKMALIKRIIASGYHDDADNEAPSENLDVSQADEDLLLGNDDNSDTVETKNAGVAAVKIPTMKSTAAATVVETTAEKAVSSQSKVSSPSVPEKLKTANGKMEERIKRFGVVSEDGKKKSRAERFQVESSISNEAPAGNGVSKSTKAVSQAPQATEDQLRKRADRFGVVVKSPSPSKQSPGSDLLKKRAERFGDSSSATATPSETLKGGSDVLLKRKARFESSADGSTSEAKKQRRAERFGLPSS